MVPAVGVEPTRVLPQQILSLPCLPISPYRHDDVGLPPTVPTMNIYGSSIF